MKNTIYLLLFACIVVNAGCDDNFEKDQESQAKADFETKTVTLKSIPEIATFLNLGNSDSQQRISDSTNVLIDDKHIIMTIDKDNNVNYSIRKIIPKSPIR